MINKDIIVITPYDIDNKKSGGSTILDYYYSNLSKFFKIEFVYVGIQQAEFNYLKRNNFDYRFKRNLIIRYIGAIIRRFLIILKNYKYYNSNIFIYFSLIHFLLKHKKDFSKKIIILEWFDVSVHINLIKYIFPNSKIIVSFHDVCSQRLQRMNFSSSHIDKLKKIEKIVLQKCDYAVTYSQKDVILLNKIFSNSKILLLTPFYQKHIFTSSINIFKFKLLFYGNFYRKENSDSLEFFYNNVYLKYNLFNFQIIVLGSYPKLLVNKFKKEHVLFMGYIEDPKIIFSDSLALIAPLLSGAGIKIKILEAFASNLPVITNEIGIEGICTVNDSGKYFMYAKSSKDYYNAILVLSNRNNNIRNSIIQNAKNLINENFNYENSLNEYVKIIKILFNEKSY